MGTWSGHEVIPVEDPMSILNMALLSKKLTVALVASDDQGCGLR